MRELRFSYDYRRARLSYDYRSSQWLPVPKSAPTGPSGHSLPPLKSAYTHGSREDSQAREQGHQRFSRTVEEMRGAGHSIKQMHDLGFTTSQFLAAGYSLQQLREVGCPLQLKGLPVSQMHRAGFTVRQMRFAGHSVTDLLANNYTPHQMFEGGFSAKQMRVGGFSVAQLFEAGYSPEQMKKAGFSIRQLALGGVSFTTMQLRDAGLTVEEVSSISEVLELSERHSELPGHMVVCCYGMGGSERAAVEVSRDMSVRDVTQAIELEVAKPVTLMLPDGRFLWSDDDSQRIGVLLQLGSQEDSSADLL